MDIENGKNKTNIAGTLLLSDKEINYGRGMAKQPISRTHDLKSLTNYAKIYAEKYLADETASIPIFVNYGVLRLVVDVPLRIRTKHSFDRLTAFEKAIESKIDFRTFFEWFRNQEDIENAEKIRRKDFKYTDKALTAVKKAIVAMLDGVTDVRVNRHPLSMEVKKEAKFLRVEQLSDGEKCTLALLGDISRRLSIANPERDNPNEGDGIVLIDEIELHMHPTWQRRILNTLSEVFPNIQFIITTHSPQVLGEVSGKYNIFMTSNSNGEFSHTVLNRLDGWSSNEILDELMGTSEVNLATRDEISKLFQLIDDGKYDNAGEYVENLACKTSQYNPDIINARMLILKGRNGL
jgi:predicted ATP-binding protein involved in virulence